MVGGLEGLGCVLGYLQSGAKLRTQRAGTAKMAADFYLSSRVVGRGSERTPRTNTKISPGTVDSVTITSLMLVVQAERLESFNKTLQNTEVGWREVT